MDRARTPESKVRVLARNLDPIDSIGQPLSITIGRNTLAEGIGQHKVSIWATFGRTLGPRS